MQSTPRPARNPWPLIWLGLAIGIAVITVIAGLVVWLVFALLRMVDRTDGHVCAMAAVRASPVAARLVGSPIEQRGLTGGSISTNNGEEKEHLNFTVRGPLGEAFVLSEGRRSPLDSHLTVKIGRNGHSETIYSGPFDCAELHRHRRVVFTP